MKSILHSVYIKHDTSFKSLTKRALAQLIIKVIYLNRKKGIHSNKLNFKLRELTNISFNQQDIDAALTALKVHEKKINSVRGKYFINETYRPSLEKAVEESKSLHKDVLNFWFSDCETIKTKKEGFSEIEKWFKNVIVDFFKSYSYDWINDLRTKKSSNVKNQLNIQTIIEQSFNKVDIIEVDKNWLGDQFVEFIQSDRIADNNLLWIYGSSMFTSALLTARNYADELSLEIFRDSHFILDTNLLMIIGLEGFEKDYAIKALEKSFEKLNIAPQYFHISEQEYKRAIGPKHEATIAAVKKYNFGVISQTDCPFIKTALKRQCTNEEDFNRFFHNLYELPEHFYEEIKLERIDYSELNNSIEAGESDEQIQNGLKRIYKRRTGRDKREKPIQHDAGLIKGAEFLKQSKNTWIITRDSTLREYAFERSVRNENPIAIGLDSLIQMLAIESGGSHLSSTEFAPLFGKIVSASIMPDKDVFTMEDLYFIERTHIEISKLSNDRTVQIARKVNRMRMKGLPDEDIVLEIQRTFEKGIGNLSETVSELESDKIRLEKERSKQAENNEKLRNALVAEKTEKGVSALRNQVRVNWLKIIGFPLIIAAITYFYLYLDPETTKNFDLLSALTVEILGAVIFSSIMKYKLFVSKHDKKEIQNKVIKNLNL